MDIIENFLVKCISSFITCTINFSFILFAIIFSIFVLFPTFVVLAPWIILSRIFFSLFLSKEKIIEENLHDNEIKETVENDERKLNSIVSCSHTSDTDEKICGYKRKRPENEIDERFVF